MEPLIAIELNGGSHFLVNRQNRDKVVGTLLEKIGIKFLSIDKNNYKLADIQQFLIQEAMKE